MAGCRALTHAEERQLIRTVRRLRPRDRALLTVMWSTGFRISEVLALTVGHVLRGPELVGKIGVAPRHLKGGYGRTRWVPVVPELQRALRHHLWWLRLKFEMRPDLPLFPSRQTGEGGGLRPLTRSRAHDLVKRVFGRAGIVDDGRLGTHTLRKTFARNVYHHGGRDIMLLKAALGHADVSATQRYLEPDENDVMAAMAMVDFTRPPRRIEFARRVRVSSPAPFPESAQW